VVPGFEALPEAERHAKAAALAPVIRGLASTDAPQLGHYTDSEAVLEFCAREKLGPLAELGTSCPDHFLRTKVRPLVVDLPGTASVEETVTRLQELHADYRKAYAAYYEGQTRRSCWCPGSGCSASARTSRRPGWPASSTSTRST
jgi:rhamnose utilization protein RhaD (predicted bifunctional aldolase and dehydrogenase)